MQQSRRKVTIVGAGPAGVAAAQQCIREGIEDVLVLETDRIGGLIYYARKVENFLGFAGESGKEVVESIQHIVDEYDIDVREIEVKKVERKDDHFDLIGNSTFSSEYVVLATGTRPKSLEIENEIHEPEWQNYTGEKVVVVGGGDVAYDYGLRMNSLGGTVTILRRSEPRALETLVEEAREKGINEMKGEIDDWELDSDRYSLSGDGWKMTADKVVTAIGREAEEPRMDFDHGEVSFPSGSTEVEGFYTVGSLVLGEYRQASLSWGMGIAAGMDIAKRVKKR